MIFPSVRLNEIGAGMSVDREAIRGLNAAVLWDQGNEEEVRKAGNAGARKKIELGCLGGEFQVRKEPAVSKANWQRKMATEL